MIKVLIQLKNFYIIVYILKTANKITFIKISRIYSKHRKNHRRIVILLMWFSIFFYYSYVHGIHIVQTIIFNKDTSSNFQYYAKCLKHSFLEYKARKPYSFNKQVLLF